MRNKAILLNKEKVSHFDQVHLQFSDLRGIIEKNRKVPVQNLCSFFWRNDQYIQESILYYIVRSKCSLLLNSTLLISECCHDKLIALLELLQQNFHDYTI